MATNFPDAVDSYTTKVDNVDDIEAAHVNNLQDAVVAIETYLLGSEVVPRNHLYHTLIYDLWSEGSTFDDIADDTYVAEVWNVIHNGQNPDIEGHTSIAGPWEKRLKCTFDSSGSKAGFVQILTAADTAALFDEPLSFGIDIYNFSPTSIDMRCAIIGWSGTADEPTTDVVADWTDENPTLATNWASLGGTPVDQSTAGSPFVRLVAENVTVASNGGYNNIAVFVWTPYAHVSGDGFYLTRAKLEQASEATAFQPRPKAEEQALCQQFLYTISSAGDPTIGHGHTVSTTEARITIPLPTPMIKVPILSLTGTAELVLLIDGAVNFPFWSSSSFYLRPGGLSGSFTTSGLTANRLAIVYLDLAGSLVIDARF